MRLSALTSDAFSTNTRELHCEIIHRARIGEYVVDEECITGRDGGEQYGVVVIHISGGVIDHQRFIR
jgi:hypothetical protein